MRPYASGCLQIWFGQADKFLSKSQINNEFSKVNESSINKNANDSVYQSRKNDGGTDKWMQRSLAHLLLTDESNSI